MAARIVVYVEDDTDRQVVAPFLASLQGLGVRSAVVRIGEDQNGVKRMDIGQFRKEGFLQEANRRFFHPMGLALEVIRFEDGSEALGGIWDARTDPEGIIYDDSVALDADAVFRVDTLMEEKAAARAERLGGYVIQPVPSVDTEE